MSGSWSEGQSYDQTAEIGTTFAFGLVSLTAWDSGTWRLLCKQKQLSTRVFFLLYISLQALVIKSHHNEMCF